VLPGVVRRAVGHHEDLCASLARLSRRLREPAVLADHEAHAHAVDVDHARLAPRHEVALLVEHRVVGKALLAVDGRDAAFAQEREGVVAAPVTALGKAHRHRAAVYLRGERRELRCAGVDERRAQQQILRGIAAQRQLRRDHEPRAGLLGRAHRTQDGSRIACEVADRLVELGDRDLHGK
jgi:hypothetical protein